jgi:hypothetical protein
MPNHFVVFNSVLTLLLPQCRNSGIHHFLQLLAALPLNCAGDSWALDVEEMAKASALLGDWNARVPASWIKAMEEVTLPLLKQHSETTVSGGSCLRGTGNGFGSGSSSTSGSSNGTSDTSGSTSSSINRLSSSSGKQELEVGMQLQHYNQERQETSLQILKTEQQQQQQLAAVELLQPLKEGLQQQHLQQQQGQNVGFRGLSSDQQQVLTIIAGVGTRPGTSASTSWASTVYSASIPWLPHLSSAQLAELTKSMAALAPQVTPSREWLRALGPAVLQQARGFNLYEVYTLLDGLQAGGVDLSRQGWLEGLLLGMLGRSDMKDMPRMLNLMKLLATSRCQGEA